MRTQSSKRVKPSPMEPLSLAEGSGTRYASRVLRKNAEDPWKHEREWTYAARIEEFALRTTSI
jgi:hypothetical protein